MTEEMLLGEHKENVKSETASTHEKKQLSKQTEDSIKEVINEILTEKQYKNAEDKRTEAEKTEEKKAHIKNFFESVEIYSRSDDNKVIENLNKLNKDELKACLDFLPGTAADNLKWIGIVDNPKNVIDSEFQNKVLEESVKRNQFIKQCLQCEDKVTDLSKAMKDILNYKEVDAYTPEQNIILLKCRNSNEAEIEPVYAKIVANKGVDTLDKDGSKEVAVIPIEDLIGKDYSVLEDNFGITSGNKSEYSLCIICCEKGAAIQRKVNEFEPKIINYYEEMLQTKPGFDNFVLDSYKYGFECDSEKWKASIKEKIIDPIRNRVPTNEGYKSLTAEQQNFMKDVMGNKFDMNIYNTYCGFSSNFGHGKGIVNEYVIAVDKDKRIPCTEEAVQNYKGRINKTVKNCCECQITGNNNYEIKGVFLMPKSEKEDYSHKMKHIREVTYLHDSDGEMRIQ